MSRQRLLIHALLLACVFVSDAAAEAGLSSSHLYVYCKAFQTAPHQTEGRICAAYVRGFLDSAVVGDVRVRAPALEQESWLDRARRTRLGSWHLRKPVYCIDSSAPLEQIVRNLVAYAETHAPREDLPASAMLRSALERFHSC